MRVFIICALLAAGFSLVSCKKKKSDTTPAFTGSVTLTNPAEGDTVSGNFSINGKITSNSEMHGYHIGVYRTDTEDLIYEKQYHLHQSAYDISETVTHSLNAVTNLKVVVEAVVEHESENVTKTVNFVFKP